MRIVHCSDLHLDRPFAALDRDRAVRRRRDLRAALERVVDLAVDRHADLITIGGDLWEDEHVTSDTRQFVARLLERAGLPVVIAPGNHDPFLPGGPYARTAWPSNVRVVDSQTPVALPFGEVTLWAVGWGGGRLDLEWLASFRVPDDGRVHLLLLHGSAIRQGLERVAAGDAAEAPFTPEAVAGCGFALCLAGHYHNGWHEAGVVYPGSPEPLGWRATGRHTAAVVEVERGGVSVELVETSRIQYVEREVDCSGAGSSFEVSERIAAAVAGLDPATTCLRVVLGGQVDAGCTIDLPALVEAHGWPLAGFDVRDRTRPAFDYESLAAKDDVVGLFVRALRGLAARTDEARDREMAALALDVGLHALAGRRQVARVD